jgi:hypothetical protein
MLKPFTDVMLDARYMAAKDGKRRLARDCAIWGCDFGERIRENGCSIAGCVWKRENSQH